MAKSDDQRVGWVTGGTDVQPVGQHSPAKPSRRSDMSTHQEAVPHYIRVQSQTSVHTEDMKSAQRQEGAGVTARKENHGRREIVGEGDKENKGGGEGKKKKPLILPSQQTASGVSARQIHWAGEVEHCSVSDLHSVYYAVTGAPRPRGGLLNSNMDRAALPSLTTSRALSLSLSLSLLLSPASKLLELNKPSTEA